LAVRTVEMKVEMMVETTADLKVVMKVD